MLVTKANSNKPNHTPLFSYIRHLVQDAIWKWWTVFHTFCKHHRIGQSSFECRDSPPNILFQMWINDIMKQRPKLLSTLPSHKMGNSPPSHCRCELQSDLPCRPLSLCACIVDQFYFERRPRWRRKKKTKIITWARNTMNFGQVENYFGLVKIPLTPQLFYVSA